jgi:ABC-type antimicrobial peptide transport system permease subunit
LARVLGEGAVIAGAGIAAGAIGGIVLARFVGTYIMEVSMPGGWAILGAAIVLAGAAILASLMPAARASRVDQMQALRSE